MDAIELELDRKFFSDDVVVRTAHRYSHSFGVEIRQSDTTTVVCLTPFDSHTNCEQLPAHFRNDALDEVLRERVRAQTADLHTTLVQAAFRELRPTRAPEE
jgi:His-Xaa-Ser system protein HxsD